MDTELTRPPILVLGTSERVGSNWVLDSLRASTTQHNEPLRQQLGREHPLAPLSSAPTGHVARSPLAAHWVEAFRRSKYHGGPHVIKETNLYFTAPDFLSMFPDAPVVILSRSPLGVASSFTRGELWGRWGYGGIYRRIVAITQDEDRLRWAELVPDDDPCPPVALTRLITLNTALLAEALGGREYAHVSYEAAVLDRPSAMRPLSEVAPEVDARPSAGPCQGPVSDDTFATTTAKSELVARLRPGSADLVVTETARCLSVVRDITAPEVAKTVRHWLGGSDAYRQAPAIASDAPAPPLTITRQGAPITPAYVPSPAGPQWRNVLVTNAEMVEFLNELDDAGFTTTRDGVHLLAVPMPHERGGRLHPGCDGWIVSPGFDHHPAYWVTWLGAAAYALWEGVRLPTADELDRLTSGAEAGNAEYRVGDVTPVAEPGASADAVHHRVGNLQTWCVDGPDDEPEWAPVTRYLHGAAWNTPATRAEVVRRRSRTLLGASRGVGVRLVRDATTGHRCPPREIADRLNRWVALLGDRGRPLAELDQEAITLLS